MAQTLMVSLLVIGTLIGIPTVVGDGPGGDEGCNAEDPDMQIVMDAVCDIVATANACQLMHQSDNPLSETNLPDIRDDFVKAWIPIGAGSVLFIEDNIFGPLGLEDEKKMIDSIIQSSVPQKIWVISATGPDEEPDCSL